MNREQMEATLALMGWVPTCVGRSGAYLNGVHVYAYELKTGHIGAAVAQRPLGKTESVDMWYASDKLFMPMARRCLEISNGC